MGYTLGLDMSSQKSGYALFENRKPIKWGAWELKKDNEEDWRKRIAYMAHHVSELCDEYDISHIYVEDVPPTIENAQTVKILSALQGMIIAVTATRGIDVEFISVKTWKNKIGINLTASKENNACKKRIKEYFGKQSTKPLNTVKGWTKGWEKKMSVDYANDLFGLDLVYKSPSSKFNDDDIADALNIAWSKIAEDDLKPYDLDTFENIMDNFYNLITSG